MTAGNAGRRLSAVAVSRSKPIDPEYRLRRSVEAVRQAVRQQNGEERALGPKAERTRASLLAAARQIFTERDFFHTSAADIAAEAGVSLGTFYQYFEDINAIVLVLAADHIVDVLKEHGDEWDPLTGRIGLRRMVYTIIRGYFDNAWINSLWHQVTIADPRMAEIRLHFWAAYKSRIEQSLRVGIEAGVVRRDLDPAEVARALTLMTERYCYDVCIFDPPREPLSADAAADLVTTLWADAIGLEERSGTWKNQGARSPRR